MATADNAGRREERMSRMASLKSGLKQLPELTKRTEVLSAKLAIIQRKNSLSKQDSQANTLSPTPREVTIQEDSTDGNCFLDSFLVK